MKKFITLFFMLSSILSAQNSINKNLQARQYLSSVKIYDNCCSYGSGTIIDEYVITNYHVVNNEVLDQWILIEYSTGEVGIAQIKEVDSINDLALLRPYEIPIAFSDRIHLSDLLSRNKRPRKREEFIGYGSPFYIGDYKMIEVSFLNTKKETVVGDFNGHSTVIEDMYTVKRKNDFPYGGASGTLMISKNSYGVFTSDAIYIRGCSSLVNREKIIDIIKKSYLNR